MLINSGFTIGVWWSGCKSPIVAFGSKDRGSVRGGVIYTPSPPPPTMPKGLKASSSQIVISGSASELIAGTMVQAQVDLQLNVLDREVFVVTSVDIDTEAPDGIAATDTSVAASLSTTNRTTVGSLADSNVMARSLLSISGAGYLDTGVGFQQVHPETPMTNMDYVAIISTNDFFCQIQGTGNVTTKSTTFRVWGYRAIADASTFAALTQSELLSA